MQSKAIPLYPNKYRLIFALVILALGLIGGTAVRATEVSPPEPAGLRPVQAGTVGPDFFNLLDLSRPGLEQTATLVRKKRYSEALNAWRDYFINKARLLTLGQFTYHWQAVSLSMTNLADQFVGRPIQPVDKASPSYRDWTGYTDDFHRISSSPPDRPSKINWFPGTKYNAEPNFIVHASKGLLGAYQRTRDPVYLQKWFQVFNDFAVNHKREYEQFSEAERKALSNICWNTSAGVVLSMSAQVNTLVKTLAGFAKALPDGSPIRPWNDALNPATNPVTTETAALVPADQLANIVLCLIYDYAPILIKAYEKNRVTPNQRQSGLLALAMAGYILDEFKPAAALTAAANYGYNDYLAVTVYPDGGDLEQSFNYNPILINQARELSLMFPNADQSMPWVKKYREAALKRKLMFAGLTLPVDGLPRVSSSFTHPPPLWTDAKSREERKQKLFKENDPWECGEASRIYDHLWGTGTGSVPSFTSTAFPYSGYYAMRKSWDMDSPYLFISGQRKGGGHFDEMCNDVQVVAYGRVLLMPGAQGQYEPSFMPEEQRPDFWAIAEYVSESSSLIHNTVIVDGCSQQRHAHGGVSVVYPDPIQSRWHTSAFFDLAEGSYADGYGPGKWQSLSAAMCRHDRQVVFIRALDCWIVTDRLSDDGKEHEFSQLWHFPPSYAWDGTPQAGFRRNQVTINREERWIKTHDPTGPNVALYHYAPQSLLYAFYYGQRNPYRGWYALGLGGGVTPAVEVQTTWKGTGNQLLVTLIEPSRTSGPGSIKKLTDCSAKQPENIAGFRAETVKGGTVTFLAATTADWKDNILEIGALRLNGEALLFVEQPGEPARGLALGCRELTFAGKKQGLGETDFEFVVTNGLFQVAAPIHYPNPRTDKVTIRPPEGLYADSVIVDLYYTGPVGGEMRYTLDGSTPGAGAALLYTGRLTLTNTATLQAQAFRENQPVGNVVTMSYQVINLPPVPPNPDVFISDLKPEQVKVACFELGKDRACWDGFKGQGLLPIQIAGKTYAKGLGFHAQAEVKYALQSGYDRFVAVAGVDDSTGYKGRMIFRVLADDRQLAESPVLSGAALRYWHFDCPLPAGARILRLVTDVAEPNSGYNMGDWANAGFVLRK